MTVNKVILIIITKQKNQVNYVSIQKWIKNEFKCQILYCLFISILKLLNVVKIMN